MHIVNADIRLASEHFQQKTRTVGFSLGTQRVTTPTATPDAPVGHSPEPKVTTDRRPPDQALTSRAQEAGEGLLANLRTQVLQRQMATLELNVVPQLTPSRSSLAQATPSAGQQVSESTGIASADQPATPRLQLLKSIIEYLTGREIKLFRQHALSTEAQATLEVEAETTAPALPPSDFATRLRLLRSELEVEVTSFSAQGQIHTADGRTLDFALDMTMSRSFASVMGVSINSGEMHDPLVINYGRSAAELLTDRFAFDLDADGQEEQIARLAAGSAFLAQDRNGNGQIDDGHELFGARTGAGFAELAAHDLDGNGFIDGADPIFAELRLLTIDQNGGQQLSNLDSQGIGAIFLGRVETPFDLNDNQNQRQGRVAQTGVYLSEQGQVGTVQHVDLAV